MSEDTAILQTHPWPQGPAILTLRRSLVALVVGILVIGTAVTSQSTALSGYPFVDAGMRQLIATGWMHNRLRMVVASFLVKDLHLPWQWGARYFMNQLVDGDLASNNHGWQWTAGTGTDAAPYFRIFNPVSQSRRFDPHGEYVRRWIPELADCSDSEIHAPWLSKRGVPAGYTQPIVDHDTERIEALARFAAIRDR